MKFEEQYNGMIMEQEKAEMFQEQYTEWVELMEMEFGNTIIGEEKGGNN